MREWDKRYLERVAAAVAEAERFAKAGRLAMRDIKSDGYCSHHSPACAAAKRASMDLTRALVAVRGPKH